MKIFEGVIIPMVTPINANYSIDAASVGKIVESFIAQECAPFVLGTTGESTSFSSTQKTELVKQTVKAVNGRVKTFAGISSTSLVESIEMAKTYRDLGIDVMVTTLPYYFPISESEMTRFFTQLADAIDCPVVLYNMPAMVGERIPLDVADHLSQHPNIVGMKDSERDPERIDTSIGMWKDREEFAFYLGWAAQSAHSVLLGADGIVPSTGNFVPELFKQLYDAAKAGNHEEAHRLQELTDQISLIYQKDRKLNTSLPALKVLMSELGLCKPHAMPPMYDIAPDEQEALKSQLRTQLANI
ncbi:dihydrodipicolinate synthase family protein [Marinoscillum sp. MHG1-6]|uniref:dihydrodipicolinate synthase family protein n=1 Tax=Marinoscillum sp. MHG1-6 TaxID=2959627 RepID=UPI0021579159|nr:dihydrodipicolinate synthase family protein [Marinoscillum sp. MHG1-6]